MAKATSDSILGGSGRNPRFWITLKFSLTLLMLGGGLRSPSAFLVFILIADRRDGHGSGPSADRVGSGRVTGQIQGDFGGSGRVAGQTYCYRIFLCFIFHRFYSYCCRPEQHRPVCSSRSDTGNQLWLQVIL